MRLCCTTCCSRYFPSAYLRFEWELVEHLLQINPAPSTPKVEGLPEMGVAKTGSFFILPYSHGALRVHSLNGRGSGEIDLQLSGVVGNGSPFPFPPRPCALVPSQPC